MNKKFLIPLIIIVALGLIIAITFLFPAPTNTPTATAFDPLNATYIIEGQPITLVNGSASTSMTTVFGQPTSGDLNGDGNPDAAVILVQQPGGSGTFYYVAAALDIASATVGTNAILLGDRIAPQTLEIANGQIVANYADRAAGQPMTTPPSVGVSKYLIVTGTTLATTTAPSISTSTAGGGAGAHCGGNILNPPTCATGYHCAPTPGSHLPFGDVGGTCVAN